MVVLIHFLVPSPPHYSQQNSIWWGFRQVEIYFEREINKMVFWKSWSECRKTKNPFHLFELKKKKRHKMEKKSEQKEEKKVCKRCHQNYSTSSNTPSSCRFHTSFFVCRRHDDQKRYTLLHYTTSYYLDFYIHLWAYFYIPIC